MPLPIKLIVTDAQPEDFIELVDQPSGNRVVADVHRGQVFDVHAADLQAISRVSATIIEQLWLRDRDKR